MLSKNDLFFQNDHVNLRNGLGQVCLIILLTRGTSSEFEIIDIP